MELDQMFDRQYFPKEQQARMAQRFKGGICAPYKVWKGEKLKRIQYELVDKEKWQ